jgi:uncharacterized SAM-binding protein YcdF (DUF218 family)
MKPIIEAFLLPPGLFVLIGVISLALCSRWTGRLLFVLNLSALYLLSTPVIGTYLMSSLELSKVVSEAEIQAFKPQVILVPLSDRNIRAPEYSGQTVAPDSLERLRYAAHLHRRTGLPVLLSGRQTAQPGQSSTDLGRLVLEQEFQLSAAAVETANSAGDYHGRLSTPLVAQLGGRRVLLATQAWHMRRMSDRLRAEGLAVLQAPTVITLPINDARDPKLWIPRLWALALSQRGMQERVSEFWHRLTSLLG